MIIAIPSKTKALTSDIEPRFGRAKYFILYNTENATFRVAENNHDLPSIQGAGIQAAQTIIEAEAEALIANNCGPKAFRVLNTADIKIFITNNCSVQTAIDLYMANKLPLLNEANVQGHW
jgi:predicted Fe-Mo cluster-binding NifX family protein